MWARWARYGGEIDWDQIDEVPFTMFGFQPCFPKVKQEKRLQYLKDYYRGMWNNYHELKLFLSVLDQNDRNEILKKFPFQILEMFLDWSLQTKLLDVVELLWPYLSEYNVRDFLFLILSRKRMLNWIGSDYVTLVAKLQERFSYGYEVFKEMYPQIFNTLKLVHENDGPRPSPHEVCLQSNDNILIAFHSGSTLFVLSKSKVINVFTLHFIWCGKDIITIINNFRGDCYNFGFLPYYKPCAFQQKIYSET
ncbi:hypothetical protein TNCT_585771 [Trichonephila clavata]|uniref:Uncharacterized protein n=1 Tax=Trichonephila clavata TaxID=2740835 RepID=A0A8X6LVG8_TRICU|nr:hypothetical protein TNCT_585771 [Trichonephila clavata]